MVQPRDPRSMFVVVTLCLALVTGCVRGSSVPLPVNETTATATSTRDRPDRPIPQDLAVATVAPSLPGEIGGLELAGYLGRGPIGAFAVEAGSAYVGLGRMLATVRLTRPARPERLGYVVLPDEILDIAVVRLPSTGQTYAYAALGQGGLCVIDMSDPARAAIVGTHYASSHVNAVSVSGAYLYVSAGALRVMSLADAAAPVEVGTYLPAEQRGNAGKVVAASDGYVYAIYDGGPSRTGDLRIIAVSEPTTPFEVGTYHARVPVQDGVVAADHAYLLVGQGVPHLVIVDISAPSTPVAVDPAQVGTWPGQSLAVAGHLLYLASPGTPDSYGTLQILDVTDPAYPFALGRYEGVPLPVAEITARDKQVFLATGDTLAVLDVTDPTMPAMAGGHDLRGLPRMGRGVAAAEDRVYVAAGRDGLWAIDVSDPSNPRVVGRLDTAGHAWNVALLGSNAYVADEGNGLRVIDVHDPARPVEVGGYNAAGSPVFFSDIAIGPGHSEQSPPSSLAGRAYAYVADALPEDTSLRVIDISDPADPREVSRLPLGAGVEGDVRAYGVAVAGNYAYLAVGAAGLRVVDISDPFRPVEVGAYDVPGRADNLAVAGDRVYLIDGDLRILDVSDPASPSEIGFYDVPNLSPWPHIAVEGGYAYLTAQGTTVLDVSDPGAPVEITSYPLAQGDIALGNGLLYVIGDGLSILRPRAPKPALLPTVTPQSECEAYTASMSLQATDTRPYVGDVMTVTATLTNQGCGQLGLPRYSLHVGTDGEQPVFSTIPEPVVHYLGLASGQSDTVEFALRTVRPGQAVLTVSASFEFHVGYPGPAYWASAHSGPLHVTVRSQEPGLVPEGDLASALCPTRDPDHGSCST